MPTQKVGVTAADWGLTDEAWGLSQNFAEGLEKSMTELKNGQGDIKGAAYHAAIGSQEVEIIVTNGGLSFDTLAALGATLALSNGDFVGYLKSWRNSSANDNYKRLTGTADIFPDFD